MATNEIYDSDIQSKSVSDSSGMSNDNVYSYTNDYYILNIDKLNRSTFTIYHIKLLYSFLVLFMD